jgi:hypothetical protein
MNPQELLNTSNVEYWKTLAKLTTDPELKKRLEELIENMEKIET